MAITYYQSRPPVFIPNYGVTAASSTQITWTWDDSSTTLNNCSLVVSATDTNHFSWELITCGIGTAWRGVEAPQPHALHVSAEEADRRLAETRAAQHRNAVRRQRAVKKGRRLLVSLLDDEQQIAYARSRAFQVLGADGKCYRLRKGGTVHELGSHGRATHSHCIHLPHSYIDEDTLIAVKLLLENDVEEFRRIANTSPLRAAPAPPAALAVPLAA